MNYPGGVGGTQQERQVAIMLSNLALSYTDRQFDHFANMPYRAFLRTKYWKMVRQIVLLVNPSCVLCDSRHNLNVHHKRYSHHGWEHLWLERDLIVLCQDCHKRHHHMIENPE